MSDLHGTGTVLPSGWALATLDEVIAESRGRLTPRKGSDVVYELYSVPRYESGAPELSVERDIGSGKLVVEPGTVLLCRINPRINRVWVVGEYSPHAKIASTEWITFSPLNGLDPRYLCYYLRRSQFRDYLASRASGVGGSLMRVKANVLVGYPFPLAPLAEQARTVAKIEELFTRLDAAVQSLKSTQRRLHSYRQSVLRDAFTGKLTAEWREQQLRDPDSPLRKEPVPALLERILQERENAGGKARRPKRPALDASGLRGLPEAWMWCALEDCCLTITKGESPHWQGFAYVNDGVTFIRSQNVLVGRVDLSEEVKVPLGFHKKLARSQLRPGDILYNIVGASIGRCALVPEHVQQANVNQAVSVLRPGSGVLPVYLMRLLNSADYQERMLSKRVEVARPNVSLEDLRGLAVPLPPTTEQEHLVEEIERRFSLADAADETVERSLKQAARLRQSILKRAFQGKLVPQDPADEPAGKLLERIREEKAKLAAASGGGRARRRSERTAAARQAPRGERETA